MLSLVLSLVFSGIKSFENVARVSSSVAEYPNQLLKGSHLGLLLGAGRTAITLMKASNSGGRKFASSGMTSQSRVVTLSSACTRIELETTSLPEFHIEFSFGGGGNMNQSYNKTLPFLGGSGDMLSQKI